MCTVYSVIHVPADQSRGITNLDQWQGRPLEKPPPELAPQNVELDEQCSIQTLFTRGTCTIKSQITYMYVATIILYTRMSTLFYLRTSPLNFE